MLTTQDRQAIQDFAYPAQDYANEKFHRSLQEALVTKVAVPISEPSVKRFGQLLGTIHIVLAEAAD